MPFLNYSVGFAATGYEARASLVLDDGPIGEATVYSSGIVQHGTTIPLPAREYPTFPMHYRIRIPLLTYSDNIWLPWYTAYPHHVFTAVLVRSFTLQDGIYKVTSAEELDDRDVTDGDGGAPRLHPLHGTFTSYGARMARCTDDFQTTLADDYWPIQHEVPPRKIESLYVATNYSLAIGGPQKQVPHVVEVGSEPTTLPFMWEVEFAFTDPQPRIEQTDRGDIYYVTDILVLLTLRYYNELTDDIHYDYHSNELILRIYTPPVPGEFVPITQVISLHNRSHHRMVVGNNTQLQRRSVFSFAVQSAARSFSNANRLVRVREVPRRDSVCVLERRGSSAPYTFKVHHEDANGVQEVMTVTGKSALIEVSDNRNEVLLILQDNNDAVYAYRSLDGGWTWDNGTRCQLGTNNMTASALHDLDFSVRRNVYFLSATVSGGVKVLVSENGVNWTDTGV